MRVYVCCLYQGPFEAMAMVNTRIYVYLMQWDAAYATFWYDQDDYTESFPCLLTVCFGKAPWFSLSFFPLKTSFFDRIIQCSCLAPVVEAHFEHVQISIVTSIDKNCQFNDLKLDMQSHMTYKYLRWRAHKEPRVIAELTMPLTSSCDIDFEENWTSSDTGFLWKLLRLRISVTTPTHQKLDFIVSSHYSGKQAPLPIPKCSCPQITNETFFLEI